MNQIEERISQLPRPEIPERLDDRIVSLIDDHEAEAAAPRRVAAPLLAVLAVAACVVVLFLWIRPITVGDERAESLVYQIEPSPALLEILGHTPPAGSAGFFERTWTSLEIMPSGAPTSETATTEGD